MQSLLNNNKISKHFLTITKISNILKYADEVVLMFIYKEIKKSNSCLISITKLILLAL